MKLGAHVSTSGGIHTAIDRAQAIGAESVQIFTQSPRAWRPTNHDPANLELLQGTPGRGGDRRRPLPRPLPREPREPRRRALREVGHQLVNTVQVAGAIDADVVFHVGSHLGAGLETGLARVVPALEHALEHCSDTTLLLIENTAGTGDTIGRSIDELASLVDRLDRHPHLGLCLDSCHLYASGYDVTDRDELDRLLEEVDATSGSTGSRALHVNDSKAPARLEPRPARQHRQGPHAREARRVPGPSGVPGPPRDPRAVPDGEAPTAPKCGRLKRLHTKSVT